MSSLAVCICVCANQVRGDHALRQVGSTPFLRMPRDASAPKPALLSETGAFRDTRTLQPAEGLVAYDINVPFWVDGAAKQRWIALPSDGEGTCAKIDARTTGSWTFPAGTVFVKHFEMPSAGAGAPATRIETRLLVRDDRGGVYGASYRWRADQSDADLVTARLLEAPRARPDAPAWSYPGPDDCRECHTPAAGLVLGVRTSQLDRDVAGDDGSATAQLESWYRSGMLARALDPQAIAAAPRLRAADDVHASLEERARSYLDVNCAACHLPGGVAADFDARFETELPRQNLIGAPARIDLGIDHARLIAPHDVWRSMLLVRMQTLEAVRMPPLGHQEVDPAGVALIAQWIASMPGQDVLAPPAFDPPGGDLDGSVRVTVTSSDRDAVIRYTTDGSLPVKSSPVLTGPLSIERSTTVRARVWRDGYVPSIVAQETYIVAKHANRRRNE